MKRTPRKPSVSGFSVDRESLAEWAKDKPLSILQLDPADRAVLRIADTRTMNRPTMTSDDICRRLRQVLVVLEVTPPPES
uniref:Uncharacterized protein n=1 Tax=Anopheles stephensi TaxID=30069 RepID=A0A182YD90_ANOST